ncbi:hypothetical protein JST97_21845 [bacterium]|nr:hypothetical protein [bacterium]
MRRFAWFLLGLMALFGVVWVGGTYFYKARAAGLYASLRRPQAGASVEYLRSDFAELIKLKPGLAQVEYKYLSQPLEETQDYLFSFAMLALKEGHQEQWELVVRILNGMWLQERHTVPMPLDRAARLNLFQQRIQALYAQARLQHKAASLPSGDRLTFASNLSYEFCRKRWEDWSLWGGLPSWYQATRVMTQVQRWNQELAEGKPLGPPPSDLESLYKVLSPLQREP